MQLLQSAVIFCLLNVNIFPRTLLSNIYSLLLLLHHHHLTTTTTATTTTTTTAATTTATTTTTTTTTTAAAAQTRAAPVRRLQWPRRLSRVLSFAAFILGLAGRVALD